MPEGVGRNLGGPGDTTAGGLGPDLGPGRELFFFDEALERPSGEAVT